MAPLIKKLLRDWRKHYLENQDHIKNTKMVVKDSSCYSHNSANENLRGTDFCLSDGLVQYEDDNLKYYFKPEDSNLYLWHFVLYTKSTNEEICGMIYIKDLLEGRVNAEASSVAVTNNISTINANINQCFNNYEDCVMSDIDEYPHSPEYEILVKLVTPNNNTCIPLNKSFDFTSYIDKKIFNKSKSLNNIVDTLWIFLNDNISRAMNCNPAHNSSCIVSGTLTKCWNRTVLKDFKTVFPEVYGLYYYTESDQDLVQQWIVNYQMEQESRKKIIEQQHTLIGQQQEQHNEHLRANQEEQDDDDEIKTLTFKKRRIR